MPSDLELPRPDRGALFVIAGPSGVGKSTLIRAAMQQVPDLSFSVSATTRPPRSGEEDGRHYHFLSADRFEALLAQDAFLEHATVYDHRYGTLQAPVEEALEQGRSVVLDIDVQGARQVRDRLHSSVLVYVFPPSLSVLEKRLKRRGTDTEVVLERRMAQVGEQLRGVEMFDYVVVNDELATAERVLQGILLAELSRLARRRRAVDAVLTELEARGL